MFKVKKKKKEKKGKLRKQKSFPSLKGKRKEISSIELQQRQKQTQGLILTRFTPAQLNKTRLKSKGERLSSNIVTKAEASLISFV